MKLSSKIRQIISNTLQAKNRGLALALCQNLVALNPADTASLDYLARLSVNELEHTEAENNLTEGSTDPASASQPSSSIGGAPSLRLGAPGDINFVVSQVAEGACQGSFSPAYLKKEMQQHLAQALSRVYQHGDLSRSTYRGIETVPADLWVCEQEHRALGFLLVAGLDNRGGPERELYMIAVQPDYRGQGLGRLLTDFFCERFAGSTLHAQCRPESEQMYAMLLRRGFIHRGNTVGGYRVLHFQS